MSHSEIIVRTATKDDIPQLLELYRELQPDDPPIDENAAATVWDEALNSGVVYFVAECNGSIAASCCIAIIPNMTRQCSPIGYIENVITAAEYRRCGVGRQLLETAVDYAKTLGCYKVVLQSSIKRTQAHEFYESIGFDGDSKRAFEIRF